MGKDDKGRSKNFKEDLSAVKKTLQNKMAEEETAYLPEVPTVDDPAGHVSTPGGTSEIEKLLKVMEEAEASEETPEEAQVPEKAPEKAPEEATENAAEEPQNDEATQVIPEVPDEGATRVIPQVPDDATKAVPDFEIPPEVFEVPPVSAPVIPRKPQGDEAIEETFRQMVGEDHTQRDQKRKKTILGLSAVFLVLIVAVIGFLLTASGSDPYDGKILNNVTVADVNLGGLTRKEAEVVLASVTDQTFSRKNMIVEFPQSTLTLTPQDTGVQLDVRSAVKAAYSYGRSGSKEQRQQDYEASLTGNHIVSLLPHLKMDSRLVRSRLEEYAEELGKAFAPSSYALEGIMPELALEKYDPEIPCQSLLLVPGIPGTIMDVDSVYDRILDGYGMNQFHVKITDLEIQKAPDPLDLKKIYDEVYIEPVDSAMDMQNFEIIPGSYGYGFDIEAAQKLLDKADYGDTVTVPMEYIEPEILEEDLFFKDVLGEASTPHSDNENRNNNLRLACETLNGMVINPGDTFSFNEALGMRTAEKGYKPAPAYSGHKLVNSLGGGICQISSTLYYTCLLSDLEIVDRINHGFPVSYIEKGLDATVSWNGPDFKFRNNTNFPIKIQADTDEKNVNFRILGIDEKSYYIKMESKISSVVDAETHYEEYGPDSGYHDGQTLDHGHTGYFVKTYRCKYDKETNELISRNFETNSNYLSTPRVVVRIVRPAEPETQPPVVPETSQPVEPPETQSPEPEPPETQAPVVPPEPQPGDPPAVPDDTTPVPPDGE